MSKDLPENIAYSSATDNIAGTSQSGDILYSFLNAPVSKLDADQYMVSDLDGVTEGLFGSGNMNFLMMQSAQTNEAIANTNPMDAAIAGDHFGSPLAGTSGAPSMFGTHNQAGDLEFFNPLESPDNMHVSPDSGPVSHAGPGGANSLAAAPAFTGYAQPQDPIYTARNLATSDASTDHSTGSDGRNGSDGVSGTSGTNGTNGSNGTDGTGTTIINNIELPDVNEAITNLFDTVNNLTDNVFNTINNLLPLDDLGPLGLNLGLDLSNISNLTLDLINGDSILNVLDETIDLSSTLDPLSGLVGNLVSGLDLGLLVDPFQYDNAPDDHDLVLTSGLDLLGIPLPPIGFEIPLDPVEFLLGDIDLGLDLSNDLLDLPILGGGSDDTDIGLPIAGDLLGNEVLGLPLDLAFDPVEDLVGDLDLGGAIDLGLLQGADNSPTDTDIAVPLNIGLLDSGLAGDTLDISLDPIENITGDIDFDLGVAGNLLGDVAPGLFDPLAGGEPDGGQLSPLGDTLSDLTGGILMPADNGDQDIALGLTGNILGTDIIDNAGDVLLNPVEDLAGDLDIGLDGGLDLLDTSQTSNSMGDTDIILPLDLNLADHGLIGEGLDIPLDPVESITGDIDLNLSAAGNLFGTTADPLVDSLAGGTGNDTLFAQAGDIVHDLAIDIDFVDAMPDADMLQDILSPIENAVNQAIDMIESAPETLGIANNIGNILDNGLTDVIGGADPDSGASWTESILPDAGDSLGGGLVDDISALLPDPVATVTSILPSIPTLPVLAGGSGGHHFGGLFG